MDGENNWVLRFLIVLLTSVIFQSCVVSRQRLIGDYCEESYLWIAEHDSHFRFNLNNSFIYTYWDDVEDKLGLGTYSLSKDSIFFSFYEIPERAKGRQVFVQKTDGAESTFQVVNPISAMDSWQCSCQLLENDSMLQSLSANSLGFFKVTMNENLTLKIFCSMSEIDQSIGFPFQYEIQGTKEQFNYIIQASGVRDYTIFESKQIKSYPIRIRRRGQRFGIKVRGEWVWYNYCKS